MGCPSVTWEAVAPSSSTHPLPVKKKSTLKSTFKSILDGGISPKIICEIKFSAYTKPNKPL